jgi:hypothetical protein
MHSIGVYDNILLEKSVLSDDLITVLRDGKLRHFHTKNSG